MDQLEGFRAIGRYKHPEDSSAWQMNLGALQMALRLKYRLYTWVGPPSFFLQTILERLHDLLSEVGNNLLIITV